MLGKLEIHRLHETDVMRRREEHLHCPMSVGFRADVPLATPSVFMSAQSVREPEVRGNDVEPGRLEAWASWVLSRADQIDPLRSMGPSGPDPISPSAPEVERQGGVNGRASAVN